MSDYIERDKIMNFCNAVINRQGNEEEMNVVVESFKAFAEYVKALPPAQPEQKWIPCSERLPEESGYYIITAHDGVGHRTTFVKYQKKAKSWDLTGARSYWRVIAWMPLPEPYAEGREERI